MLDAAREHFPSQGISNFPSNLRPADANSTPPRQGVLIQGGLLKCNSMYIWEKLDPARDGKKLNQHDCGNTRTLSRQSRISTASTPPKGSQIGRRELSKTASRGGSVGEGALLWKDKYAVRSLEVDPFAKQPTKPQPKCDTPNLGVWQAKWSEVQLPNTILIISILEYYTSQLVYQWKIFGQIGTPYKMRHATYTFIPSSIIRKLVNLFTDSPSSSISFLSLQ